jgi:AcrR family transcriptional regulator
MVRWQPDSRDRLERAALELFAERGFAETTVPQITERAGLTTRTFFRHFADKREVLFVSQDELPAVVTAMMADTPASDAPMTIIERGLARIADAAFDGRRDALLVRKAIIESDEGLRERELHKRALLAEQIRDGFVGRGADPLTATIAAELSMTVVGVSLGRWLGGDPRPLVEIMRETLAAVRSVAAG